MESLFAIGATQYDTRCANSEECSVLNKATVSPLYLVAADKSPGIAIVVEEGIAKLTIFTALNIDGTMI